MAETVKLLVGGEWVASSAKETVPVYNPSDGTEIAATPLCDEAEVDQVKQEVAEEMDSLQAAVHQDKAEPAEAVEEKKPAEEPTQE